MTPNTRLLLVGGGALAVVIGVGVLGSIVARPDPGPAASAAQSVPRLSASPIVRLTEFLGVARPELVARSSEGARVVRHRRDDRGSNAAHGHAAARWQGARGRAAGLGQNGDVQRTRPSCTTRAAERWSATGSMQGARDSHTATLLQNGTVLVAGGGGGTS